MDLVNLDQYPIHLGAQDQRYKKCVSDLRSKLVHEGVAICPDFLTSDALGEAVSNVSKVKAKAWTTDTSHNIYLDSGDPDFPTNHIRNKLLPTTVASVAYDYLPPDGALSRLYKNEAFIEFLRVVLDQPVLYRLEDPFGACSINLFKPGWAHNWHFDESQFSTTIMLQTAQEGGHFEHTLPIRGGRGGGNRNNRKAKDEEDRLKEQKHYDQMTNIVDGKNEKLIKRLDFEAVIKLRGRSSPEKWKKIASIVDFGVDASASLGQKQQHLKMYPQTAFYYRQTAPNGGGGSNKLSDHFNQQKRDPRFAGNKSRGFVRLDSLDGSCHTIPSRHNSKMDTADQKISPSEKESKWFGYQPQHFQQPAYSEYPPYWPADYQHQQFYWPQPYQNHYQVPFNLNKGQYELWQMEPVQSIEHHGHSALSATSLQSAVPMFDQQAQNGTTFTRCVNYIFGTVGTVIASAFSTTTSLSSPSSASSVSSADSFQSPPRSLNPNARVFTPLNPNAKEFRPAAAKSDPPHDVPEDQEPEPVTPPNEEEVQLKAVSYRKCTPWIPKGSVVKDESGLLDSTEEEVIAHEDEDSEDDSDDEDDDAYENSRQRLLSVCSSEDNFIQFEAESPKEPRKLENCSKFLKDFIAGHSDSDDDDGQEGDDDWDSTVDAIFIDDEDILEQCGLQCQWMIEAPKIQTSVGDRLQDDEDDDQVDHHKPKEFPTTIDRELMLAKIRDANEQWKNMEGMKKSNIKVAFYEPVVTGVLEEDPELASDLRSARVSDFAQRKADTERLLRLLTPIFSEEHRSKMRTYIQSYLK